jgi:transcriptional regulator with XRE-family HTH domain
MAVWRGMRVQFALNCMSGLLRFGFPVSVEYACCVKSGLGGGGLVVLNDAEYRPGCAVHLAMQNKRKNRKNVDQELPKTTVKYADIPRKNARFLADSVGGFARFAEKVGISDAQVSQILGKNPTRNIGSRQARRIETAFEQPIGWLDKPHDGNDLDELSGTSQITLLSAELDALKDRTAKASACLRACLSAPDIDRENLLNLALSLLEET